MKLSDTDYERLKQFFVRYVDWFVAIKSDRPEDQPLAFLARIEKTSVADAKRGLQMAINDVVEATTTWTPEQVAQADAKFAAEGTFTLSELRRRYSKKYMQILKRGVIRNETEYYLVKGIIDGGGIEPGATEGPQLQAMLDAYEARGLSSSNQ